MRPPLVPMNHLASNRKDSWLEIVSIHLPYLLIRLHTRYIVYVIIANKQISLLTKNKSLFYLNSLHVAKSLSKAN